MKKILMALAASATALIAFATINTTEGFEYGNLGGFIGGGALLAYEGDPPLLANYPFDSAGSYCCDVDADGTDALTSPDAAGATYFDMYLQFPSNASEPTPDLDYDAKLAVYVNSASNVVVISGGANPTNVTDATVAPDTWARLTIAKVADGFKVYVDGTAVNSGAVFEPIVDGNPSRAQFTGVGKLDNYVARTTDPFIQNPAVTIGGEGYASIDDARLDNPGATYQLEADATLSTPLEYGELISVKLNNHVLSGITTGLLVPVASTVGDDTIYRADYFPRTATPGQNGTNENPYEIADADDLQALQAAVAEDAPVAGQYKNYCYVQTADIDMGSAGAFAGIGAYAANPTGGTPFSGTYDGGNFKICNVDFTQRNYGGIFNQVNGGTIKNLTVSNITCSAYSASVNSGEFGFAIIGNAGNGAVLTNIVAEGVFASAEQPATHNIAGIVVRASAGGTGTLIKDCVNSATLHGAYTKAGGICAITQKAESGGVVAFEDCVNAGTISMYEAAVVDSGKHAGQDGLAGILGYVDCDTTIKDCANTGALSSTYATARVGQIVGWAYSKDDNSIRQLMDLGGNAAPSNAKMVDTISDWANVTGFKYATVDNGVATTIASPYTLVKDAKYLLEGDIGLGSGLVYTFYDAGTIAFDTALGYTFAGIVAADTSTLVLAEPVTEGTLTTYTASAGAASVDGFAYATFAEALAAIAEGDDYVTLLANAETTLSAGNTLKVKKNDFNLTVNVGDADVMSYAIDGEFTTYICSHRAAYITKDGTTTNYASLSSAVEAAASGDTITLDKDTDENISLPIGVSFALNGYNYTGTVSTDAAGYKVVEEGGTWVVVVDMPDYSPWSYSSGIVVWRAASGQLFHASTVADVAADGTIGSTYNLNTEGHPWQVFASNQSAYTTPGHTLVFDEAGYNNNSDAQFAPMSFGGMWVKALQAENTPYCITDTTSSAARQVELGAANANTYFKFDESFTFNRNSATKVLGEATVEIASGKTFTINARANKGALVESGNTLVLKGAGTLAVVGGLNVSGTLDLSAATRPTISGNVTLNAGSTIVLPAGTETGSAINVAVCSETLAASGLINVQIGDADAVQALLTVSGGAITRIDVGGTYTATVDGDTTFSAIEWQKGGEAAELPGNLALAALEISGSGTVTGLSDVPASVTLASGVTLDVTAIASSFADLTKSSAGTYMFTDNYPLSVPQGYTYEYVGGSTEAETATISGDRFNNSGNLKTSGYLAIDDFWTAWTTASLEVLDGKTTVGANNDKALRGTVTIRASAELVNAKAADALAYGVTTVVNVYGTLSMGETRWTVGGNNTINVYGGTITGVGQGTNGALDFMDTSSLNADETSEISASIRFRNALTSVTVAENKTLTLSGVIRCQYAGGGVTKQGKGNLTFTTAPNALQAGIVHKDGHLVFNTQDDVTLTVTYNTAKTASTSLWYATQSNWKGTVKIDSLTGNLSWLTGAGNADSTISMQNVSNAYVMAAGNTTYSLPGTLSIDAPVEFNNGSSGSTVNITNLAGSSTLVLGAWSGCSSARYNLHNVDVDNDWTGTLVVSNGITRGGGGTFTVGIGNIETANTTPGRCVLPITNVELEGHTGTVAYNIDNATLNGNPASFEVKSDGIYVAEPPQTVTVTVPAVANTTVTVEVGGETIGTAAGNYDVEPGSVVKVTYAAADGYQISGTTVYEIDTNSETTFTPSETQVAQIVAYIGETPYTSLASAFSAVEEGDTLTLVGSAVTLADNVTVSASYTLAGDAEGTTVTGAGKIYLTGSAELTLDATLTSVGNQFWFSSKDAKLTFPTAGTAPIVRPYTGCQTGTTVNGDGTSTYYQYLFLQLLVGSSNVSLAYENGDPLVQKQVYEGDEIVFTATPAEGYENPVVTVNGAPLAPVDGKYTVVVGTVNVAIQATATAIPPVAQVVHGETATPYLTLAEAVAAAEAGDTIRLLGNLELDARVEPNKTMTFDLGGYTLSRTGTGGNGSVIDVKSGNVVITNGVIDCTQDDAAIVANGVYAITARSGANVTLDTLTVTVDSECGACVYPFAGATVTILGGTYANRTSTPYRYKTAWTGMALNQVNKKDDGGGLTQRITVYGGSFKQVDPTLGDDSWADGEGTFLASGYAATWNPSTGYYDVAEVQEVPVVPGTPTEPVDTEAEAEAIAKKTTVEIAPAVASELTTEQQSAYKDLFEARVVEVPGETTRYAVAVELKDEVVADLQEGIDDEKADVAAAAVAAAAAGTSGSGTADVATVPGLYYVVEAGTGLNDIQAVSCTLATGESTSLAIPNKGTSGFYKLRVSVTPVVVPAVSAGSGE